MIRSRNRGDRGALYQDKQVQMFRQILWHTKKPPKMPSGAFTSDDTSSPGDRSEDDDEDDADPPHSLVIFPSFQFDCLCF